MAGVFSGCQIVLDLSTSVGFKKKLEIRKKVTDNGGVISYIVTKKSTHVVCNDEEKADVSYKCKMAQKYAIPVVSQDFLFDCVDNNKLLNCDDYIIVGTTKSEELSKGKIVASKNQTSEKKKKKGVSLNVGGVKAWPYLDKNAPEFNEKLYEVAKYALFKKFVKTRETTQFCVLEVHVVEEAHVDQSQSDVYRFRVFSHRGDLHDIEEGKSGITECRYVKTSDEALAVYSYLHKQQTDTPNSMTQIHRSFSRLVGSPNFQQMLSEHGLEQDMTEDVSVFVEHIWSEAVGEIENIISVPLNSIKLEKVEKAEALLMKLRELKAEDNEITSTLDEFYSTLPHHPGHVVRTVNTTWLAKKQDVCQLIKDMVSVSEATNWSMRASSDAKYRALRCSIEHLQKDNPQYKVVRNMITSAQGNVDVNIQNIFAVNRPVEYKSFKETDCCRLLFHASKAPNFVGILSRGLLLPKVVVDDFGGKRTDAGMLGNGIYFASAVSTSSKYSLPSTSRGTRMMLVNEVSLGRCKDYFKYEKTLDSPPEGYDSTHGVARTDSVYSDFTDDEFVVYNTSQQKMKYIVEFTVGKEVPNFTTVNIEKGIADMNISEEDKIDLLDVQDITDPMTKVKAGLVAEGEDTVELVSVDIRARLMDLASEVIVFQEYRNNSSDMLEAKYIFPLDETAAVCGFEAFINGKHIVGEVKEKETAHKEYKKAISEGHGAYLMDQDEETPDVFTVSVGNLPPRAKVLIKITYVSELQVEDEMISFRLPGSVAPWKKQETEATLSDLKKTDIDFDAYRGNSVKVLIEMPFDIRTIECPTHKILMKKTATMAVIEIAHGQVLKEGFQLLIGLAEIHVPRMWVEEKTGDRHERACMLTFYPEFEACDDNEAEIILTLDLSNSMKGKTLTMAKKILLLTLRHLPKTWRFNVVVFGTTYRELFPSSQPNKKIYITAAEEFIQATKADLGNTEIYRPLRSFYLLKQESSMRNIFLVSDGHINNEEITLNAVNSNAHHTRIFTFGVSETQNRHLLRALARVGAGAFESFDSQSKSKWERKVKAQLTKAGQPGLTSVSVNWEQHGADVPAPKQAPNQITALFSGSRQVIYGYVDNCLMATLQAEIAGQEISTLVSTAELRVTKGKILHCLTAKAIIRDWEDGVLSPDRINHEVMKMNLKKFVIELSKEYCIVTQLTSFIAVEKREKDEMFDEDIVMYELVETEDVDKLQYMSYEGEDEDEYSTEESGEESESDTSSALSSDSSECEEEGNKKGVRKERRLRFASEESESDSGEEEEEEMYDLSIYEDSSKSPPMSKRRSRRSASMEKMEEEKMLKKPQFMSLEEESDEDMEFGLFDDADDLTPPIPLHGSVEVCIQPTGVDLEGGGGGTPLESDDDLGFCLFDYAEDLAPAIPPHGRVEGEVEEVNSIFKDLGSLVQEQSEMIDSMQANVESADMEVEEGRQSLSTARQHIKFFEVSEKQKVPIDKAVFAFECSEARPVIMQASLAAVSRETEHSYDKAYMVEPLAAAKSLPMMKTSKKKKKRMVSLEEDGGEEEQSKEGYYEKEFSTEPILLQDRVCADFDDEEYSDTVLLKCADDTNWLNELSGTDLLMSCGDGLPQPGPPPPPVPRKMSLKDVHQPAPPVPRHMSLHRHVHQSAHPQSDFVGYGQTPLDLLEPTSSQSSTLFGSSQPQQQQPAPLPTFGIGYSAQPPPPQPPQQPLQTFGFNYSAQGPLPTQQPPPTFGFNSSAQPPQPSQQPLPTFGFNYSAQGPQPSQQPLPTFGFNYSAHGPLPAQQPPPTFGFNYSVQPPLPSQQPLPTFDSQNQQSAPSQSFSFGFSAQPPPPAAKSAPPAPLPIFGIGGSAIPPPPPPPPSGVSMPPPPPPSSGVSMPPPPPPSSGVSMPPPPPQQPSGVSMPPPIPLRAKPPPGLSSRGSMPPPSRGGMSHRKPQTTSSGFFAKVKLSSSSKSPSSIRVEKIQSRGRVEEDYGIDADLLCDIQLPPPSSESKPVLQMQQRKLSVEPPELSVPEPKSLREKLTSSISSAVSRSYSGVKDTLFGNKQKDMHNTIEAVLEREEKLDTLVDKSEGLSMQSKAFHKTSVSWRACPEPQLKKAIVKEKPDAINTRSSEVCAKRSSAPVMKRMGRANVEMRNKMKSANLDVHQTMASASKALRTDHRARLRAKDDILVDEMYCSMPVSQEISDAISTDFLDDSDDEEELMAELEELCQEKMDEDLLERNVKGRERERLESNRSAGKSLEKDMRELESWANSTSSNTWSRDNDTLSSQPLLLGESTARKMKIRSPRSVFQQHEPVKRYKPVLTKDMFGIGSPVPRVVIVQSFKKINPRMIAVLSSQQKQEGNFLLSSSLDNILGMNSEVLEEGLYKTGLKSLGGKVTADILSLVTTAMVILVILIYRNQEPFPLNFSDHDWKVKVRNLINSLEEKSLQNIMSRALEYCDRTEKEYPWVCTMLELGHNWFDVAQKMIG